MKISRLFYLSIFTFTLLIFNSCEENCGSDSGTIKFINETNLETVLVFIDDNYKGLPVRTYMKTQEINAGTHEYFYRLSTTEDFRRGTVTVMPCEEVTVYIQ